MSTVTVPESLIERLKLATGKTTRAAAVRAALEEVASRADDGGPDPIEAPSKAVVDRAAIALRKMQAAAKRKGLDRMTTEEIDAEIKAARRDRRS